MDFEAAKTLLQALQTSTENNKLLKLVLKNQKRFEQKVDFLLQDSLDEAKAEKLRKKLEDSENELTEAVAKSAIPLI